ncbi:glycosyltransferase family 1 protein [Photobacterium piscicola]|uniref:glycosyltransferase family 4 protein n=1 Tax=Photobacterium piscicola TaxID=1378299 RepID=UPI002E191CF1|nr:glycosyltransferase family 1 protein [Photobacterium piscicola]
MKIELDCIIFSLQKGGGISVYFSEIIKRLKLLECDFDILNHNDNFVTKEYNFSLPKKATIIPLFFFRYMDVYLKADIDIFHSSYYRLPIFWQRKKVRVVTTVHDFTYEKYSSGIKKYIHHWQKKRAIINSDVIICISKNTKKDLLEYIPEAGAKKIEIIYNGVSDDYHKLSNEKETITNNIIFVGARSGYKNFEVLVRTLGQVKDKSLVIIGGGDLTEQEIRLLDENIQYRYEHKSFISNNELNFLYNNSYCLVYPSLYEGFGIPAIEAMKAGCPVIAANSSSLPEVCGDAAILLDKINEESLKEAIKLLSNKKTRNELIDKGFNNAKRFSWDKMFKELEEIYLGKI